MTVTIAVLPGGDLWMIYADEFADLQDEGRATVSRASHVEPAAGGGWLADLAPVGGPVVGPLALRSDALRAEAEYLTTVVLQGD